MIKIMASGSALSATTKHIGTQNTGNSSLTTASIVELIAGTRAKRRNRIITEWLNSKER